MVHGERMFECTDINCCLWFHTKERVQHHIAVVHNGIKTWECEHCDKKVGSSGELRRHSIRRHMSVDDPLRVAFYLTENVWVKNRYATNPVFRIIGIHRGRQRRFLKTNNIKKMNSTHQSMGCEPEKMIEHLNDNDRGYVYGDPILRVDHIRPLHNFGESIACALVQYEAFSYLNQQLLTVEENSKKSDRYTAQDAAIFEASENGKKLSLLKIQWKADKICEGCKWCA